GPAMYAYNNAIFSEDDWRGIQTTGRSVKRNDPNKVGRFGIGFNSVYHITDMPSIFSGKHLGMLDPQEKIFGEKQGGNIWSLDENEDREELLSLCDQVQPLRDVLGQFCTLTWEEMVNKEKHFPGTLFRFPLRMEPSDISETLYDSEKMFKLFKSFSADADMSLLFLRHVTSISLIHVDSQGAANLHLQATASMPSVSNIEGSTCLKDISYQCSDQPEKRCKWLVTVYFMTEGLVPDLDILAEKLSFSPQVGLAFPWDCEKTLSNGRLSCFLPLPNNEPNKTGLPLHLNACFGLTDNRRHIKWQEEDQKYDEAALWNELLVEKVLPLAYHKIILDAIELSKHSVFPVSSVYKLWPDIHQMKYKEKWLNVVMQMLQPLLELSVLYLAGDEKRWVRPAEALFLPNNNGEPSLMKAIAAFLIREGKPLVTIPTHVSEALRIAFESPESLTLVSPALVRNILRQSDMTSLSRDDKLFLLEYVLSDGCYPELRGLQLLPLSDGSFECFTENGFALIENQQFPRCLLPGYESRFVPKDLRSNILQHLMQLQSTRMFRIFNLDASVVTALAMKSLPKLWQESSGHVTWEIGNMQHPPMQWLQQFWNFLRLHEELHPFVGMPLIPLAPLQDDAATVTLARLMDKTTLMCQKSKQASLPDGIAAVISKTGGTLISIRDKCLKHTDLDMYILTPSPANILQLFLSLETDEVIHGITISTFQEKEKLKSYLSNLDSFTQDVKQLLLKLPLFQQMPSLTCRTEEFLAAGSKQAVMLHTLPAIPGDILMPKVIIKCETKADQRILFLFHQEQILYGKCRNLSFIVTNGRGPQTASSLFDPCNETFQVLFESKFFPPPVFTNTPKMLVTLRQLGLKCKEEEISPSDALIVAKQINNLQSICQEEAFRKAEALIRICNLTDVLSKFSAQQIGQLVCYIKRVPEEFLRYTSLLKVFGVKESFSNGEIVDILYRIKLEIDGRHQNCGSPSELKLPISILNWMRKNRVAFSEDLPIPVRQGNEGEFNLQPLSCTVFCDISKEGLGDLREDKEEFHVIHKEIPQATAQWLNVPLLSTRILHPELIGIVQCGQMEPITLRIKNILKEYDEEHDLFKELIQNAEDAGAQMCNFMVDNRQNSDSLNSLIDPNMSSCHGPCLWAFNNEQFTEEDWLHITQIGSDSKDKQVEKIGKFGLGFNAVYHVTDIPSILSGKHLVIFDPNVTHLKKHISSKGNPGIKLDLFKERLLRRFPGQFKPYEGIYGCHLETISNQKLYEGTLIKLPFRTQVEAQTSEISKKVYSGEHVKTLVCHLKQYSQILLLFLKKLCKLSLDFLPESASTPPQDEEMNTIVTVTRNIVSTISIPDDFPLRKMQRNSIQFLAKLDKKCEEVIDGLLANIVEVSMEAENVEHVKYWLIYSCFGMHRSLELAVTKASQQNFSLPVGSVAVPLQKDQTLRYWEPDKSKLDGNVFCFLPLSISSGLPVHWNQALIEDSVTTAYITALLVLKKMYQEGKLQNYDYYTFWHYRKEVRKSFQPLISAFYSAIAEPLFGKPIELFSDGENWCSIDNATFLHPEIQNNKKVGPMALQAFCNNLKKPCLAIPLPQWVRDSFQSTRWDKAIQDKTFGWLQFYREIVFNNLSSMEASSRNSLVLHAIDMNDEAVDDLLMSHACIPTQGAMQLQFIGKLVHPLGKVACLYEVEEGRFLEGTEKDFLSQKRILRLLDLGMLNNFLPLADLAERAETISEIWEQDRVKAYRRVCCILDLAHHTLHEAKSDWDALRNTPFIPACCPYVSNDKETALHKAEEVYSYEYQNLVSMSEPTVDKEHLSPYLHSSHVDKVLDHLGVLHEPPLETVLLQLQRACLHSEVFEENRLTCIANQCYNYLEIFLKKETKSKMVFARAQQFPFILIENKFVHVAAVAKNVSFDARPYLYELPWAFSKFTNLWNSVGIKDQFTSQEYMSVLKQMENAYKGAVLSACDLDISLQIVNVLHEFLDNHFKEYLLPDKSGVLRPSSKLNYNDTPWLPVAEGVILCHDRISRSTALCLKVRTTRHHTLQNHLVPGYSPFAMEFGQREKLTVRIKNIIAAYPSKKDILKELIQNADDAQATEIHFVWDGRSHKTTKTFGEKWNPLQGPALCVYNNTVFSDTDLKGIQQLGEGGKKSASGTTGKYGLGFNSVYHLTDCPAILTGDKWLCISDPHLKYVDNGTEMCPGSKYSLQPEFIETFVDVYNTFLPTFFDLDQGTMFRLPIRTNEMAGTSEISNKEVTLIDIRELLQALQKDPEDLILFLRHIKKIEFQQYSSATELQNLFSVEIKLPEDSSTKKVSFQNHVLSSLTSQSTAEPIGPFQVIYPMEVLSSGKKPSQWIMAEKCGSSSKTCSGRTNVPCGAVAACVNGHIKGKAFCGLPLPGETGLPVHVNGNFEVDFSRRDLWKEDGRSMKTNWNELLKLEIIAPLYADLLNYIRASCIKGSHLPLPISQTLVKNKLRCKTLVDYCLSDINKTNSSSLSGLPLLLTHDQVLRSFQTDSPKFFSRFVILFQGLEENFAEDSLYLKHFEVLHEAKVLKELNIPVSTSYLKEILQRHLQDCAVDPQTALHIPDKNLWSWLKLLWQYIDDQVCSTDTKDSKKNKAFSDAKVLFSDSPIIPVLCPSQNGKHLLATVKALSIVVFESIDQVISILFKLGFVRLDTTFFTPELLYCHIKPELLDETNRCAVLEQLHPPQNVQFDLLSECDFNALLMFFHAGINSTSNRDTYIRKLKSLPLFEPVQGGRQRIDRYRNVFILNTDLLHTFPDLYLIDDNSVFLKYNSINLHLSTAMDITVLNDVEFYVKFILPSLGRLTEDQTLDTVRMLLEIQKYPDYMQYKDPIISCLRKVRFIRNVNGELQDASYFYDKEVEFYQLMLPQERFIPATFWNLIGYKPHKVKRLLKDLGLKHTVSEEELLHFAHQIENEVKGNVCLGQLQLKSAALLEHLGNKKQEELQAVFLKRLSTIKFVFPKKIQDELCKFHRPFAGGRDVVAICGSLIKGDPNHELLIWTTVPILPLENSNENYLKILKSAGAVSQPPTAHVIENLTNICQAPCQACDVIQTRCKVLRFSYGYLQTVEFDPKPLSDISLVLVEGGATLVKPSCTVLTVRDDTEFRPYLYKLPPKLALYEEFFCKVGVAETPSSRHYSRLLQDVHEDTSDKQKLNANQIKAVTRTVEHLFLLLKEKPEERKLPHLQPLYLPATDDRLHASDSLYFNDTAFPSARCEPPLGKKVKLLEKLVKCYLGHDLYEHQKLLQLLPLQVRPKMFSQVITEDLLESSLRLCEYGEHCRFRGYFLSRLSSSYFQYGLICLIRRKTSGKVSESDAVKLCEDTFSKIQMNCCERLETTLLFNSEPLPETSAVKLVCLKRNPQGCVFYLEHNEELNVRAITQINGHLLREINSLLNNVLNLDTVHILGELLVCENLESVVQVLQDNGIHDCKVKENEQSGLPKPGSLIPDEWIHALDMDFLNNFEKGEYVGFKSPSPDEVYCYAVVVDRLNTITSQGETASQRYKIEIGTAEFVVVSSLDLHQIKRPKRAQSAESTCRDLVLSDSPIDPTPGPTRTPRKSLQEIKKEVDECLRQVWDLPEEERRKAIRRLYLKWHPDKYTECVSLATKVSQYIQQRVKDLEEGRLMTTSGFESARANRNQSYGGFYQQWDREASRHQRGRARFYQNFPSQDYNFWTFHGGERSQQPSPEAKRWFRQAQCDLAAASHDSGGKASEWFFFKVHQAVEKALIAVKYKKTGQQPTNCTIGNLGQQVAQYSTKLSTLPTIVNRLKEFGVHPKKTQYPNYYPLPLIPNDQFSPQNENLVLELATELLRKTQAYISD
ncbi:SACS protein, partial [Amia calva]|nr:SACS protein [Amia calva]